MYDEMSCSESDEESCSSSEDVEDDSASSGYFSDPEERQTGGAGSEEEEGEPDPDADLPHWVTALASSHLRQIASAIFRDKTLGEIYQNDLVERKTPLVLKEIMTRDLEKMFSIESRQWGNVYREWFEWLVIRYDTRKSIFRRLLDDIRIDDDLVVVLAGVRDEIAKTMGYCFTSGGLNKSPSQRAQALQFGQISKISTLVRSEVIPIPPEVFSLRPSPLSPSEKLPSIFYVLQPGVDDELLPYSVRPYQLDPAQQLYILHNTDNQVPALVKQVLSASLLGSRMDDDCNPAEKLKRQQAHLPLGDLFSPDQLDEIFASPLGEYQSHVCKKRESIGPIREDQFGNPLGSRPSDHVDYYAQSLDHQKDSRIVQVDPVWVRIEPTNESGRTSSSAGRRFLYLRAKWCAPVTQSTNILSQFRTIAVVDAAEHKAVIYTTKLFRHPMKRQLFRHVEDEETKEQAQVQEMREDQKLLYQQLDQQLNNAYMADRLADRQGRSSGRDSHPPKLVIADVLSSMQGGPVPPVSLRRNNNTFAAPTLPSVRASLRTAV